MTNETQLSQLETNAAKEKNEILNQAYQELKNAFDTEKIIEVDVLEKIKSVFKCSYKQIPLYLPISSYTSKQNITEEELSVVVGKKLPVKVERYSITEYGKDIKINHKDAVNDKLWAEIKVGMKVDAIVKKVLPENGVVVTLSNGLEAFMPLQYLSRERLEDITSYIAVGDMVKGEIVEMNKKIDKIIYSLRNAPSKHLNAFFDSHKIGERVTGKLKTITKSKAIFTIAPNIFGFVKMLDVSWTRSIIKFADFFEYDKEYEFEIINLDRDNQEIGLSYRKTQPNNWEEIANKYEKGFTYSAVVVLIPPTGRGAVVSVNDEIDGFMPKQRAAALYNRNKPNFKENDVIQVKLIEKNPKTYSFIFESALKQENPFDQMGKSVTTRTNKNLSKPEVIKNFTIADLLSDSSKKALK